MASAEAVGLFAELASVPSVKCGSITKSCSGNNFLCNSTWNQRDLTTNRLSLFSRTYAITDQEILKSHPSELNNEQWNVVSHSGSFRAVVRKIKDNKSNELKQYIEIWSEDSKNLNLEAQSLEQHGEIYDDDSVFGSVKWSPSETKLLYIAEEKQPKSVSYFKQGPKSNAEIEGELYVYKDSWGEQMINKCKPVLCLFDSASSLVSVLDWLPQYLCYGQAIWGCDDSMVYVVGWYTDPYRLGIIYCPIRKNVLLKVNLKKKIWDQIGPRDRSISFPVLSPMGDKMVYLDARCEGPHMQCSRLILHEIHGDKWKVVVDVVASPSKDSFPGLYCSSPNHKFWSKDNVRVVLQSHWRSRVDLLVIDTNDLTVKRLTSDTDIGCWKLLALDKSDNILACRSSVNQSDQLVLGRLPESGHEEEICWRVLSGSQFDAQNRMKWSIIPMQVPEALVNKDFGCLDFECLLIEPIGLEDKRLPLLVFNHGGPHSVVPAGFNHLLAGYCLSGLMVLLVNYRGSIGFGQDNIESLLGNIGTQDVLDVKHAVDWLIKEGKVDQNRMAVTGGSHGGFLSCHLIGQFPELFKVAVVRNPVFNLTTLLGTSDIPDWAYTEMGLKFEANLPMDAEMCSLLYSKSPIAHVSKVKTPTLFLLGANDLRVPPRQGLQCSEILKSKAIPTRVLMYPDSNHPLSEVESESDGFVNGVLWIKSHLEKAN